jgi:hypothetical protein
MAEMGKEVQVRHVLRWWKARSRCFGDARADLNPTALPPETVSPRASGKRRSRCSHERIVDRDYEDLAGVFELRRVDIARDMFFRA